MGLTIHYKFTVPNKWSIATVREKLESLRQACMDLPVVGVSDLQEFKGEECQLAEDTGEPFRWAKTQSARHIKSPWDADATGEMVEDGFVVRKNSMARLGIVTSAIDALAPVRKSLIDGGILVEQDGHLRFTQDYLFSSPSGAAAVVLGRTANGWGEWKDKDGKTLNEIKRGGIAEMAEDKE